MKIHIFDDETAVCDTTPATRTCLAWPPHVQAAFGCPVSAGISSPGETLPFAENPIIADRWSRHNLRASYKPNIVTIKRVENDVPAAQK
jgi:hypothetical protein